MYRISELFTIIVEYPDSLPAIEDLKVNKRLHALETIALLWSHSDDLVHVVLG